MTDRKDTYDRIAPWYDLLDWWFEWARYRAIRPRVFDPVAQEPTLLDCGTGTGRNLPFYPTGAAVTAFDLSRRMLSRAKRRARKLRPAVAYAQCDVGALPFAENRFSAATATFLFCVLPDESQSTALGEIRRVVRPGGRIVLLDYTLSEDPWRRRIMRIWGPWVRFAYGAAFDRDPEKHARAVGLIVEDSTYLYEDILRRLVLRVPV